MVGDDEQRSALLRASKPPSKDLFSTLITANHILHNQNVVDAYGHISVRNPQDPNTFIATFPIHYKGKVGTSSQSFVQRKTKRSKRLEDPLTFFFYHLTQFISKSLAPALVASRDDLEEYLVADASPVNADAPKGYAERFIHSEIYKKYHGVQSVVHAHAEAVLPFSISSIPLRPVFHMAGVMGPQCPVYDIAQHYKNSDSLHSMLVTNEHLGASLAAGFSPSTMLSKGTSMLRSFVTSQPDVAPDMPACPTILMRGHGFTCVGTTIEEAVYRAVYTCVNARVQTQAVLMQGGFNVGLVGERFGGGEKETGPAKHEDVKYLSEREAKDAWTVNQGHAERPWKLWCAEVERLPLYRNELGPQPGA